MNKTQNYTENHKNVFSFVEFIVVFTLLFCIFALIVTMTENGITQGKFILCSSNQSRLGVIFNMYCHKNRNIAPEYGSWIKAIEPFAKVTIDQSAEPKGILRCPAQELTLYDSQSSEEHWRGSHYGINQHITTKKSQDSKGKTLSSSTYWDLLNIKSIKDPSTKVIMADASGGNFFGECDKDPTIAGLSLNGENCGDSLPPKPASPFPYLRHPVAQGNFLFIDGHVEVHSYWPSFSSGKGTYGYYFWHPETIIPDKFE
ncbi:MAG: hypothetical protein U9O87_05865 [Verrucomicrobiota bacterium]|nr:hypothetical protein [Verrucomicrobiota bacterium]